MVTLSRIKVILSDHKFYCIYKVLKGYDHYFYCHIISGYILEKIPGGPQVLLHILGLKSHEHYYLSQSQMM